MEEGQAACGSSYLWCKRVRTVLCQTDDTSMEDKRKPKRWLLWLVVGLTVLVAYPLSYGPYNWLYDSPLIPGPVHACLDWFYSPLGWVLLSGPKWASDPLLWYCNVWVPYEDLCKPP